MSTPRLHIPFSAAGFGVLRLFQATLAGASLMFLFGMGWLWWETQHIEAAIIEHEEAVAKTMEAAQQFRQQAEADGYNLSDQWLKALPQQVAFADELALHQKFSWTLFLNDLESAVPKRISMESVVLDFKNSLITLSGAALTLEDLKTLVDGLEQHPAFQHVVLANHKIHKKKDKDKERKFTYFTFNLEFTYQPGAKQSPSQQPL